MAYRDRGWYIQALERAKGRVTDLQTRVNTFIEDEEFDAAKMLLTDLADALTDANHVANQFAEKFGG